MAEAARARRSLVVFTGGALGALALRTRTRTRTRRAAASSSATLILGDVPSRPLQPRPRPRQVDEQAARKGEATGAYALVEGRLHCLLSGGGGVGARAQLLECSCLMRVDALAQAKLLSRLLKRQR